MKKKIFTLICVFAFALFLNAPVKADASIQDKRLGGLDRYSTNIKVIDQGWQKSEYAVIVNGENFPDALSAAPLAKKYNAPLFLTFPTNIDFTITNEFDRLGVKKVFIIGGPAVVSTLVEDSLKSKGISYERIYGADRYLTSIEVANKIGTSNGVVVTTGDDFADALSVAPVAGKLQMPILLAQQDVLDSIQKKFISDNTISKTYVLGGTDIISDNVASKFPNVQRIDGRDKYSRNLNIIKAFENDIDFSKAILASGEDFPDALSGSAFAALNGNPILLVSENTNKNFIENILGNKNTNILYALGGTNGISDNTLNGMTGETNALNTIKSKIKLNSKLQFGAIGTYSYDGSNYYRISLYTYNEYTKSYITDYYQYDFLVDMQTGDTYKIDTNTNTRYLH